MFNQDENEKIKSDYKIIRKRQLIVTMPILPVMFYMLFWGDKNPAASFLGIPLMPLVVVMVVLCLIFSLLHWRCPACKGYLGKRMNPRFCPKCGVELK